MRTLILILTIFIIFSGCVEDDNITQTNESPSQDSVNLTPENQFSAVLSSKEVNVPEIEVTSFSSVYMYDNLVNTLSYLFSWDSVPGNENFKLRNYLRDDLGIYWVSDAKIVKTDDNNTIRVFTPTKSLELKLSEDKNTVQITPQQIQLEVKEKKNGIRIYKVEKDDSKKKPVYNLTERYYAVYGLSIKNNGSKNLDFNLSELHIRDGNQIFNTTHESEIQHNLYRSEIFSDLENENKLKNATLFPGQTINGSVVFYVNSLYNESFLLMYNATPIPSASFEESIVALKMADNYNYSGIFGIPPYNNGYSYDSYEPDMGEYPYIWPNWVNRSVVEFFNRADSEDLAKSSRDNIFKIEANYVLKVIPERNIKSILKRDTTSSYQENYFIIFDGTGEELINTSLIGKIAILNNQTYKLYSDENDIPQMNFSNATVVRISYFNDYTWTRLSFVNQDLILDDKKNVIATRWRIVQGQY